MAKEFPPFVPTLGKHPHCVTGKGKMSTKPWTRCVIGLGCQGKGHGGIVLVERCKCGMIRETESNGTAYVKGKWRPPTPDEREQP